jgi:hypothetical protein
MNNEHFYRLGKIRERKIIQDFDSIYDSMRVKADLMGFSNIKIIRERGYVIFYCCIDKTNENI